MDVFLKTNRSVLSRKPLDQEWLSADIFAQNFLKYLYPFEPFFYCLTSYINSEKGKGCFVLAILFLIIDARLNLSNYTLTIGKAELLQWRAFFPLNTRFDPFIVQYACANWWLLYSNPHQNLLSTLLSSQHELWSHRHSLYSKPSTSTTRDKSGRRYRS